MCSINQYYINASCGLSIESNIKNFFHNLSCVIKSAALSGDTVFALHAPFSLLHLVQEGCTGVLSYKYVYDINGDCITHFQTHRNLVIPESTIIGTDVLDSYFEHTARSITSKRIKSMFMDLYYSSHPPIAYGDYMPLQISFFDAGKTLCIEKFLTCFALCLYINIPNFSKSELLIVFHPDILFFLTNGTPNIYSSFLFNYIQLLNTFNCGAFFENVSFKKVVFKKSLFWPQNPMNLALLANLYQAAICIDVSHMEKIGLSDVQIRDFLGEVITTKIRILIHIKDSSRLVKTITTIYENQINYVIEPTRLLGKVLY